MNTLVKPKVFDLEKRTFLFAKNARIFVARMPKSVTNDEDCQQLVRSSGSIGSNVIEANESASKKDYALRMKLSRKECKESQYRLSLMYASKNSELEKARKDLIQESGELTKIFSSIFQKSSGIGKSASSQK
ncbi:four helix bundle protein [Candidatus Peregrinibacteria bacterium]|nr:four helix bundle protein [Candidatus Peregrinibacteria bacterium]